MRGLAEATLVGVILAVVGGIVLGGVTFTLLGKAKPAIDLAACKADVQIAAITKEFRSVSHCYTKPAGELPYSGDPKKYDAEVSQGVAELLKECRYQFGETTNSPWAGDWFTSERVCFVCSTFRVPSANAMLGNFISVQPTLTDWMATHKTSDGRQSYLDYLKPSLVSQDVNFIGYTYDVDNKKVSFEHQLEPWKDYAVISFTWLGNKVQQWTGKELTWDGVKTHEEPSYIHIIPTNELSKECEITFLRYP